MNSLYDRSPEFPFQTSSGFENFQRVAEYDSRLDEEARFVRYDSLRRKAANDLLRRRSAERKRRDASTVDRPLLQRNRPLGYSDHLDLIETEIKSGLSYTRVAHDKVVALRDLEASLREELSGLPGSEDGLARIAALSSLMPPESECFDFQTHRDLTVEVDLSRFQREAARIEQNIDQMLESAGHHASVLGARELREDIEAIGHTYNLKDFWRSYPDYVREDYRDTDVFAFYETRLETLTLKEEREYAAAEKARKDRNAALVGGAAAVVVGLLGLKAITSGSDNDDAEAGGECAAMENVYSCTNYFTENPNMQGYKSCGPLGKSTRVPDPTGSCNVWYSERGTCFRDRDAARRALCN